MKQQEKETKKPPIGRIIGLLLVLFAMDEDIFIIILALALILVPIGLVGWLVYRAVKQGKGDSPARRKKFDSCPRPLFCFHKDKGEHHVRKGREIDPWDRPDIDISKYQRKG